MSVRARDSARPTLPASKAEWGRRRGIKSVSFSTPCSAPSVTLPRRPLYIFKSFHAMTVLLILLLSVDWDNNTVKKKKPTINLERMLDAFINPNRIDIHFTVLYRWGIMSLFRPSSLRFQGSLCNFTYYVQCSCRWNHETQGNGF